MRTITPGQCRHVYVGLPRTHSARVVLEVDAVVVALIIVVVGSSLFVGATGLIFHRSRHMCCQMKWVHWSNCICFYNAQGIVQYIGAFPITRVYFFSVHELLQRRACIIQCVCTSVDTATYLCLFAPNMGMLVYQGDETTWFSKLMFFLKLNVAHHKSQAPLQVQRPIPSSRPHL